jgi:hypothetical protein
MLVVVFGLGSGFSKPMISNPIVLPAWLTEDCCVAAAITLPGNNPIFIVSLRDADLSALAVEAHG